MIEKVKTALRIKTNAFDGEVSGIIAACLADLHLAGIIFPEGDPLIERAIVLYAKANFGFLPDSEKYQKAYEHLKCALGLAGDYHVE